MSRILSSPLSPGHINRHGRKYRYARARVHFLLVCRSGVQPQHDDLGDSGLHRPCNHRKSVGYRDFLLTGHAIGDDPAADPATAAENLPPKFLAGCRIERIEVAAQVAKEHDASGGWSESAEKG